MVLTFPNMGNVSLAASALCQALRIPYVAPEPNHKDTLRLGSRYAPEEICLPFKLMLGNFLQCIEQGADTVLITGSCGPCRFGEYCELAMQILRGMGYGDLQFIVIDFSPEVGPGELRRRLGALAQASPLGPAGQAKAWRTAYRVADLCDRLDAEACFRAGYERNRGDCLRLLRGYKAKARLCRSPEETFRLLAETRRRLVRLPTDPEKRPLRVSVIGEIFTVIDPFSSGYLEERLMEYGVATRRMLSPSWWVRDLLLKPVRLNCRRVYAAARPYLPCPVGGHGRECVGEAVLAGREGMDGAIQVFPLGCMPEIVAKAVLPAVQRDADLPVLTLVVDEVSGEAGYLTRIEAFLDMLEARRRRRAGAEGERAV